MTYVFIDLLLLFQNQVYLLRLSLFKMKIMFYNPCKVNKITPGIMKNFVTEESERVE